MIDLCYLDDKPISFDERFTLDPALRCLEGMRENAAKALDTLLIELISEQNYDALRDYPITDDEMDDLIEALQIAVYGVQGAAVASEFGWVVDHLDDLDADFLRFYGLDYRTLDSRRFFALASRLGAYGGVISARLRAEQEDENDTEVIRITASKGGK